MRLNELCEDIEVEFAHINETLTEIRDILQRESEKTLTRSDITAGATYLAQCYNGIENILKRISRFRGVELPTGPFWHAEFVAVFTPDESKGKGLPPLADSDLFPRLTALRKFRHTVAHGYAVSFDRDTVLEILGTADETFSIFKKNVRNFIEQASGHASV